MTPLELYADACRQINELKKKCQEIGQQAFKAGAAQLFEKYPELGGFTWTQYTPYFNDGDVCLFGVHADDMTLFDVQQNTLDGWEISKHGNDYYRTNHPDVLDPKMEKWVPIQKEVEQFVNRFELDDMEEFFGNHVQVSVYRDGRVDISDYYHD